MDALSVDRMTDRQILDRAAGLVSAADAVLHGAAMSEDEDGLELVDAAARVTWAEEFLLATGAGPGESADAAAVSVDEAARRARTLLSEADAVLAPLMADDDVFSARGEIQRALALLGGWV